MRAQIKIRAKFQLMQKKIKILWAENKICAKLHLIPNIKIQIFKICDGP